jgi:hypothetical protein
MNTGCRLALLVAITGFILTASALSSAVAQEKPGDSAYDWLNGRWSGPNPDLLGGELELHLRVVNGNQITGRSRIPPSGGSGKVGPYVRVSGTVEGDNVHLELHQVPGRVIQRLTLSHKEENLVGRRKDKELIFKKLN